jgi:flagellar biosynthesis/type III secretory pathway chaperone
MEELHKVLSNEAETYRQLVDLTQREREALQKESLVDLTEVTHNKEVLMGNLVKLEQLRGQVVTALAKDLNLPAGASLLDLINHLDETIAQKLSTLRQEFINLVEQLLTLNHGNQLLLQSGLAHIEATFDYLASVVTPADGNYTARGGTQPQQQTTTGNMLNWQA